MRQLRTRRITRASVFGVAALIGALSLTACSEEDRATIDRAIASSPAVDDGAPLPDPAGTGATAATNKTSTQGNTSASTGSSSAGSSGSSGSKSSDSASGPGTSSASGTSGSGGSSTGSSGSSSGNSTDDDAPHLPSCDGTNSKVKGSLLSRPINHVLLTVTNTGSTACNAVGYPGIGYQGAQAVMDYDRNSVPQAVIVLEPGQSAYASVRTSAADGSGEGGSDVKTLRVNFQDNEGGFSGAQVSVPLGKSVWIDSSAQVTYWQSDFDTATSF